MSEPNTHIENEEHMSVHQKFNKVKSQLLKEIFPKKRSMRIMVKYHLKIEIALVALVFIVI